MGPKIIVILFFVFILGVVIYLAQSGLASQAFQGIGSLVRLPTSTPSNGSSYYNNPSNQNTGGGTSNGTGSGSGNGTASGQPAINPADIPAGFTAAQLSRYFHQVRLSGVSAGANGQITLSANFSNPSSTVDVTGWRIMANRGGEYVPQAINLYDPSGITAPSDIILQNGAYVNMYAQSGPFNLRLNQCIGYIGNQNKFNPQLPGYCPPPDHSGISSFTGACQNIIYSLGSYCQVPDLNNLQIPPNDYACRTYIENNFNYRSCFNANVGDADFLSNAWWVWMGSSPLDQYHDNVYLYDRGGFLVDTYVY